VRPMQEKRLNIYQRVNEIRKVVSYAKKDKAVQGQGYKAVTHDAVTALLRNHLIEHGVVVVPSLTGSRISIVGQTKNETPIIRFEAHFDVAFVNVDDPTDRIVMRVEAHANDHSDKAPGKATSYATKYAMLKVFSIETGEDDESRVDPYHAVMPITDSQAADIAALIEDVGADKAAFLKYLGAKAVGDIPAGKFADAVAALERKRKAA
jgi:hypothetical protein